MRVVVAAVDRLRAPWARAAVEEYLGRVGHYGGVERLEHLPLSADPLGQLEAPRPDRAGQVHRAE